MPEKITVKPRTDSPSDTTQNENSPAARTSAEQSNPSPDLSLYLLLCAAGLLASFFMPWVKILFGHPSGFDLQKLGDVHTLYWAMPAFAAVTIIAALMKKSQRAAAQIAGTVPFIILIFWMVKFESNYAELLKNLDYGAYVALVCGGLLELLGSRVK
jgi:hypothetical protein